MTLLTTTRLRLEPFSAGHLAGLNAMNADPQVMRYLATGQPQTLEETRVSIERVMKRWAEVGYSWWVFIEHASGQIVGAGAIQNLRRDATLEPDLACPLEIGWRLRRDRWGRGLATEAARAMARHAFDALKASELFAVCDPANLASAKVMQRLGMQELGLQRWYGKDLLTYRLDGARWRASSASSATVLDAGPFFHGTKADLRAGDLLSAGFESNYRAGLLMNHIYFTALAKGAGLAAEIAKGDGRPRVYLVEPTGSFENDPNVTDKKFPGNPTRSYRSTQPLKIVGEVDSWERFDDDYLRQLRRRIADGMGEIIN